ncbi:peptidoglycan D,D-transpeptidase FtsI family protein [Aquifex aeolicus]|uniref:Penicillin binding protein 2 n=1 Tax=Aquifex aeolicus (strain VF5) TaxID=224324 RepID=O66831_AQUAE|nr:penicillin-binding protein 2 [Aquifex aeolicus]AAC06783.1 penicillin binding protein 2 [Aquifex aeolicus VF5]
MEYLRVYQKRERVFKRRVILFVILSFLAVLLLLGRILYINLFKEDALKGAVKDAEVVQIQTYRGSIKTSDGKILALSYPVAYVYASKFYRFRDTVKREKFIKELSKLLGVRESVLRKRIKENESKTFFELITFPVHLKDEVRKLIKSIDYDEESKEFTKPYLSSFVGVDERYKRYYPHGNFASNLLGFVTEKGYAAEGIERLFDEYLRGGEEPIKYLVYKNKGITVVESLGTQIYTPKDLTLSIDFRVQALLEEVKKRIVKKWRPKKVVLIVMETSTGKVRGYTTYPDYDPNKYERYPYWRIRNFGVTDRFEVGSVFKPFLVAFALDRRKIRKDTLININYGKIKVHKKYVRDVTPYLWKKEYITPRELLVHSSNVGAIRVGLMLKPEEYYELFKTFKLLRSPGVLEGEVKPSISDLKYKVNRAYASIGQGVAFNPLHLITSFNALVNGKYVKPSFVEEEKTEAEKIQIKPSTVKWIRDVLIEVVEKGTGKRAKSEYYFAGGKTGTAQKYDSALKTYSKEKLVTYFLGFFPSEPKFTVLILVDEPKGKNLYGGTVAAPYFKEIIEKIGVIYGVKRDRT